MNYNVIPLFKTHHSIAKSLINVDKPKDDIDLKYPISIFTITKKYNLNPVYIVDDNMSGFLKYFKGFKDLNIDFRFGWRFTACNNAYEKTEDSKKTEHKIIVFALNTQGYYDLIKLYNCINTNQDTIYGIPRGDFSIIHKYWTKNLTLCIPFFDSFLHRNLLTYQANCIPDFGQIEPTFFSENHELPHVSFIQKILDNYTKENNYQQQKAHSIYYYSPENFLAFSCLKTIARRTTINKPNIEGMASSDFDFLTWEKLNDVSK